MLSNILLVSNFNTTVDNSTYDSIINMAKSIIESNKNIIIFREDILLYEIFKNYSNVKFIRTLSSTSDKLLHHKNNKSLYEEICNMEELFIDEFNDILKKSIKRFLSPKVSDCYDLDEYKSRRISIMNSRIKMCMTEISKRYEFIIQFKDKKEYNYMNSIKAVYGDGKFIYIYNCQTKKSEFYVGGCLLSDKDFYTCIKEV